MLNEDLKRQIKQLFLKGFEEAIIAGSEEGSWVVKERQTDKDINHKEFFVLTISSQLFRVFLLLHFTRSAPCERYVSDVLKVGGNNLDEARFYDYLGEVGNSFCGSLKRELNKIVPSMGMSTPNKLNKDCLKYIHALKIDFESHAIAEYKGTPLFYASTYVCADEELPYTVNNRAIVEDEIDTGELEFF